MGQPAYQIVMDVENDYADPSNDTRVDLETVFSENSTADKRVFGCIADNMRLPFNDATFEAYVSNLSLMIV